MEERSLLQRKDSASAAYNMVISPKIARKEKKCSVCKRQHPTPLHGDFRKREENTRDKGDPNKIHLDVSGPETNLLLSTMHATDELIKSRKVGGLIVQDFKRQITLHLPKAFSREIIPAKRSHIPRPE